MGEEIEDIGEKAPEIFTVGHSTRTLEEFIALLKASGVERLADVRTIPRSRHNPQFNNETLPGAMKQAGLAYSHLPGLGGLRHSGNSAVNAGWRNASFRSYADYMQTPAFSAAMKDLIALACKGSLALMCAEAVPWRCHRSLIADALLARNIRAVHILGPHSLLRHELTAFAKVRGTRVTYPAAGAASVGRAARKKRELTGGVHGKK